MDGDVRAINSPHASRLPVRSLVVGNGMPILLLLSTGEFDVFPLNVVQEVSDFLDHCGHAPFCYALEISYVLKAAASCVVTEGYTELEETK